MLSLMVTLLVRVFLAALNCLPMRLRLAVLSSLLRLFLMLRPDYRRICHKNLALVFPDKDSVWREEIIAQSINNLALVVADFARLPTLTRDWVERHVEFPYLPRLIERKRAASGPGALVVTGHLGSFELQGYCMSLLGYPLSFVVRNFQLPALDRWWNARREQHGNRVIDRKGAIKNIIREIKSGRDVAILFDQNVRREHAVFVEWFGRPAATTKAVAIAALRTHAPVIVSALVTSGPDKYRMDAIELDFSSLYSDTQLSEQQKAVELTTRVVREYERLIRQSPGAWFWMHRRWRTAVDPSENFYRD